MQTGLRHVCIAFSYLILILIIIIIPFSLASDDAPPSIPSEYWGLVDSGSAADGQAVQGFVGNIDYAQPSQTTGGYYDVILVNGDRELTYNDDRACATHWAAQQACVPCNNDSDCIEGPQDSAAVTVKINGVETSPQLSWLRGSNNRQDIIVIMIINYELPLLTGWNLISLPLQPDDTAIANVLGGLSGQIVVWYYNASTDAWTSYDSLAPFPWLNTLQTMGYGNAYWLKSASAQTLTIQGDKVTNHVIDLKPSWNFVGYNFSTGTMPGPISGLTTPIVVWAYYTAGDEWRSYDTAAPFPWLNTLTDMTAAKGYWLKSSVEQNWTI
jgi:hypothetical protein